jgi:hypothetical protein
MSGQGSWWPELNELDGLELGRFSWLFALGFAILLGVTAALVLVSTMG